MNRLEEGCTCWKHSIGGICVYCQPTKEKYATCQPLPTTWSDSPTAESILKDMLAMRRIIENVSDADAKLAEPDMQEIYHKMKGNMK